MSKILGIHTLELKPGVTVEEFEIFAKDQVPSYIQTTPGYSQCVYKGVKGNRIDKYILVFHLEGEAARKRYFLSDQEREAFYRQLNEKYPENPKIPEKLRTLVEGFTTNFTDYDCIASTTPYHLATDDVSRRYIRFYMLELKPDVTPEQFETFCNDLWSATAWVEGETCYVMKGIKGERANKYAFVITVEGQTAQARRLGSKEVYSAAWEQVFAQNPQNRPSLDELKTLVTGFGTDDSIGMDYVEV